MIPPHGMPHAEISTPDGLVFKVPLAGPAVRFLALGIDTAAIAVINLAVLTVLSVMQLVSEDFFRASTALAAFALGFLYFIVLEWLWRGQTLGKHLLGLRVVDVEGLRLAPWQVILRNVLRLVDMLPAAYGFGGAAVLLSPRRQRLGDLVAGTLVAHTRPAKPPNVAALAQDKYNSFREYPHIEARLRQRLSAEGAALVVEALLRRDELDPAARVAIHADLAGWLRGVAPFPETATAGLTDEQYLRNAVETLYRRVGAGQRSG